MNAFGIDVHSKVDQWDFGADEGGEGDMSDLTEPRQGVSELDLVASSVLQITKIQLLSCKSNIRGAHMTRPVDTGWVTAVRETYMRPFGTIAV